MKRRQEDADRALLDATVILILAIRCQNVLFGMNLDGEIETCEADFVDAVNRAVEEHTPSGPCEPKG